MFSTETGPRTIRLRAKADRIDLMDDGSLRVVDYKLGKAPKPSRALQLPVYGTARNTSLDGGTSSVGARPRGLFRVPRKRTRSWRSAARRRFWKRSMPAAASACRHRRHRARRVSAEA